MPASNGINKLDYPGPDSRQPLLQDSQSATSQTSHAGSFFEQVAEGIQEQDRQKMKREVIRYSSFVWAVVSSLCAGSITAYSLYGHLFMQRLHYSQGAVNIISIAAELAMYLPVPAFGYLCDRFGPRLPSFLAALLFGAGYLLAALTYKSGPPADLGGHGWPFWVMVVAFVCIGMGTSSLYLSAVATCAKNFGRGKHKGIALAIPIAAFGLSGMWQSQVGSRLLYERRPDGSKGDVDVFRYFIFLALLLFVTGTIGSLVLKIVGEEEMIDEAVEELEQSGLLEESELFQRAAQQNGYGTIHRSGDLSESTLDFLRREAQAFKDQQDEERRKKNWLLNEETRFFLADHTMWWLAAGFFLVIGPGEAFINNLGTMLGTFYPPDLPPGQVPTSAATHVSIVAIASTVARIVTGTLSDVLAPAAPAHAHRRGPNSMTNSLASLPPPLEAKEFTVSRIAFLLLFSLLISVGQVLLAAGLCQNHGDRFWVVSALVGAGYGAVFSLVPIIVSVVWGVENFGTNWGIVAMVPAAGAAVWGIVYSAIYQSAAGRQMGRDGPGSTRGKEGEEDVLCYGLECYAPTFWAMAVGVWIACGLWLWAWRGPGGWYRRGVAV
ncbi:MFS general substrate transporter [Aulographum hederae CBS 113979]|uniref:Probable transporter MCH1 n=1 Tax=Aulographum hederae CBS 113979 TaxID=1176131 RepID=A0A6G1GKJ6_9PEZI|nr:MFS general substrate transporter [Aulographum hederae CBS 113979]